MVYSHFHALGLVQLELPHAQLDVYKDDFEIRSQPVLRCPRTNTSILTPSNCYEHGQHPNRVALGFPDTLEKSNREISSQTALS